MAGMRTDRYRPADGVAVITPRATAAVVSVGRRLRRPRLDHQLLAVPLPAFRVCRSVSASFAFAKAHWRAMLLGNAGFPL